MYKNFGIRINFAKSNLAAHLRWLDYLTGKDFPQEILRSYQRPGHMDRLVQLARQVVNDEIYQHGYDQRKIEESVKAQATTDGAAVYFDPAVATAKAMRDGNNAIYNYAAFFEKPVEFDSFIEAENPLDSKRYRPFFGVLEQRFQDQEERELMRALRAAMVKRQPRRIA